LKAAVETLTTRLNDTIAIPTPPSPNMEAIHSLAMESIAKELSVIRHELRDALGHNPPGKRKHAPSTVQQQEPQTPSNRRPATQKERVVLPEHSLMHSRHATSAAQAAANALKQKLKSPLLLAAETGAEHPIPVIPEVQDTILPKTPNTAAARDEGWKTIEGKEARKRKQKEKVDKRAMEENEKPPGRKPSSNAR
jgi:hypothetical protein